MPALDGFPLDAEITISELRQEELLGERLHTFGHLRLRRRNALLGVLVEAGEWRALEEYVHGLEQQLERHEDQAVREIIAQRAPNATFVQATPDTVEEIELQYRTLSSGE